MYCFCFECVRFLVSVCVLVCNSVNYGILMKRWIEITEVLMHTFREWAHEGNFVKGFENINKKKFNCIGMIDGYQFFSDFISFFLFVFFLVFWFFSIHIIWLTTTVRACVYAFFVERFDFFLVLNSVCECFFRFVFSVFFFI